MKLLITILGVLFIITQLDAQSDSLLLDEIFRKTIKKTKSIKTISYDIEKKWVSFGQRDTTISSAHCIIDNKFPDSLLGQRFYLVTEGYEFLYNGKNCYRKESKSSVATSLLPNDMDLSFFRKQFLDYWLNHKVIPEKIKGEYIYSIKYLGVKSLNNRDCYTIEIVSNEDDIENKEIVFICKKSYLPIKCITTFRINGSSMAQFSEKTISNIKLNKDKLPTQDFLKNITQIIPFEKEVQVNTTDTALKLKIGDEFPNWDKLEAVNSIGLIIPKTDKIILIDFWYMSCYPCLKSIPIIKQLQKEYADNLSIVSFNPYDETRLDLLNEFIEKQKITYSVILPDKQFVKDLNILCYPTFILVDSKKKITFIHYGVTDNLYDTLKSEIEKSFIK